MCGIVGLLTAGRAGSARPGGRSAAALLEPMTRAVAHRGPDDDGVWSDLDAGAHLGHRRLSIVDLSPTGHQPMISGDGRWVIVLNGEIYDHAEQRAALAARGIRLRGGSDTEVLLELVAADGPEAALRAVDGMFALALWDRRERCLVLARDRLGEKPLYYGHAAGVFAFASELGALRTLPGVPTAADSEAVAAYLRWGYVPAPLAVLPGFHKLPAGCTMRVRDGRAEEPVRFWDVARIARAGLAAPLTGDDEALTDALDAALRASVSRRLLADVPVGAFLSGGVDSSTVVAVAQAVSSTPVRTFTVAVGGAGDESAHASAIAAHLGTDHTVLALPELDALDLASRAASIHDEPFADPSAIPMALLCAATRQEVTVALSGDGADELFAGYNRHKVATGRLRMGHALPAPLRRAAGAGLAAVPVTTWDRLGGFARTDVPDVGTKVHKLAGVLRATSLTDAYRSLATQWDPAQVMVAPPPPAPERPLANGASGLPPLASLLLSDQQGLLPDDMLVKVDRASMAVALEVRSPFLDHRLVELSWRLPEHAKVRGGQGKWVERALLERYVPRALWERPKVGFDPPLAAWLPGPLREWAGDLLSPARLRHQGLLRPEPIQAALTAHLSGRQNRDYALWTVLMLQAWLERTNGETR